MNWKDPEIAARLKRLWAEGHSCSTIARMIGAVSRNSVIGAVRRQGLPYRGHSGNGSSRGRHRSGDYSTNRHTRSSAAHTIDKSLFGDSRPDVRLTTKAVKAALLGRPAVKTDALPLPMPTADDKARVSFIDLKPHHCRFITLKEPAGPFVDQFCGLNRMPGSSYCPGHHARTSIPVTPRLRAPVESNVITLPVKEKVAA